MTDVLIVANDPLLLHRLKPFVRRLSDGGYSVMTAERETRMSTGPPGEDFVRDVVLVLTSVVLTKEYERIKEWLREWFLELPKPKKGRSDRELWIRIEDENRKVVGRFPLRKE